MAVNLAWILSGEDGIDGRIEVSLECFGTAWEFGVASDVFVGADLDYDSAVYQWGVVDAGDFHGWISVVLAMEWREASLA